jgi:signal transduction histidine kinase
MSLDTRRLPGDSSLVAGSYNGIGLVIMRSEDYDESRKWFMKAVSLIDSVNSPRLMAMIYNNTGVTYENQGKFKEGRRYYYRSIALKNRLHDLRGLASTYGNLGDNFRESGEPDEALKYASLSQRLSIETRSLDYLITSHKLMAYAYEQKQDFKNAYEHFQIYHDLQDSLFNSNKARQVNDMLARYHAEKRQKENESLKVSAALNESTLTRQKVIIIGAAISLGVVLLVMNFLYNLYSRSKKLAADLAVQKAEAEQMNSQLNLAIQDNLNITNFMVHDLRAPMNKVAGFTSLIQKDGTLNPQQTVYAAKLIEVVDQGRKLIDDLLTVNKPKLLSIKSLDYNNFLQDIIRQYSSVADQKNITISYDLPDGSVIIESDEELLNRMMDNLFSNAIKFSPSGSNVAVKLKEEESLIAISIKDEGPGFTEEDQKSLYQKFKRLSARPTNGESSTGLGLAIAKNIVDLLGGTIVLKTELGKGSTFTVEFPKQYPK